MSKMSNHAIDLQNELSDFEARLKNFDWMYEYTDSHNVYRRWSIEDRDLKSIAAKGPEFAEMYAKYKELKNA